MPQPTPRMTLRTAPRPTSNQLGPFCEFLNFLSMGESVLLGCGGRRGRFRLGLGGGGGLAGRGLGHPLVLVVGDIEAAALENEARPAADQPFQRQLVALRAFPERQVPHGLELLEMVT